MWAGWEDIRTAGGSRQAEFFGIGEKPLLVVSETFVSSTDICLDGAHRFAGAISVTLVRPRIRVLQDSAKAGTPTRRRPRPFRHEQPNAAGRVATIGERGRKHNLVGDHDGNPNTIEKCVSVNFTDFSKADADAFNFESLGDGRISPYVPYTYDAVISAAKGFHSLFESKDWPTKWKVDKARKCREQAKNDKKKSTNPAECGYPKTKALTGRNIYKHILLSKFEGFSGKVQFRCSSTTPCSSRSRFQNSSGARPDPKKKIFSKNNPDLGNVAGADYEGDRDASQIEYSLWNFDGDKMKRIGSYVGKDSVEVETRESDEGLSGINLKLPITWPGGINSTKYDQSQWDVYHVEPPSRPSIRVLEISSQANTSKLNISWECLQQDQQQNGK